MAASSGCSWFVLRLTQSQACEFRDIPASGLMSVSVVMGRSGQIQAEFGGVAWDWPAARFMLRA